MARVLIGISSWADPALGESGLFYPAAVKGAAEMLRFYAGQFPLVEVDSTYYTFPSKRAVTTWAEGTPPGFVFDVKAFRLFTQHPVPPDAIPRGLRSMFAGAVPEGKNIYVGKLPEDIVNRMWWPFGQALRPLHNAGKLGAVVLQFPPWFRYNQDSVEYLERCASRVPRYQIAVEFRASGWLDGEHLHDTLGLLRRYQMALVCVDEPQGLKSSVPPVAYVTAPKAIVRFHGRNREKWESQLPVGEKFGYLYSEDELGEWVPRIVKMAKEVEEVHLIFKNKPADFSIRNAREMGRLLDPDL